MPRFIELKELHERTVRDNSWDFGSPQKKHLIFPREQYFSKAIFFSPPSRFLEGCEAKSVPTELAKLGFSFSKKTN